MDLLHRSRHFRDIPGEGDPPVVDFMRAVTAVAAWLRAAACRPPPETVSLPGRERRQIDRDPLATFGCGTDRIENNQVCSGIASGNQRRTALPDQIGEMSKLRFIGIHRLEGEPTGC